MTPKLNLFLSMLMMAAALGCFYLTVREARGRSVPRSRLFTLPLLAILVALILLLREQAANQASLLWAGSLIGGLLGGALRGSKIPMRVDHMWNIIRLRRNAEGLCVAGALVLAAGLDIAAPIIANSASYREVVAAAAALCAGLLSGRALAVMLRFSRAPQVHLRSW
jgi:hypothetical protein